MSGGLDQNFRMIRLAKMAETAALQGTILQNLYSTDRGSEIKMRKLLVMRRLEIVTAAVRILNYPA